MLVYGMFNTQKARLKAEVHACFVHMRFRNPTISNLAMENLRCHSIDTVHHMAMGQLSITSKQRM